jgi:hypothetical protein
MLAYRPCQEESVPALLACVLRALRSAPDNHAKMPISSINLLVCDLSAPAVQLSWRGWTQADCHGKAQDSERPEVEQMLHSQLQIKSTTLTTVTSVEISELVHNDSYPKSRRRRFTNRIEGSRR